MAANYRYATEEYAGHTIEKIRLVKNRIPSLSVLKKFSMKEMKEDPFHLQMEMSVLNTLTGKRSLIMLEKNQTLGASVNKILGGLKGKQTAMNIDIPEHLKGLTVGQMKANIDKYYAETLKKDVNKYSLSCSNCQMFGVNLLRASGFDVEGDVESFADQKAGELIPYAVRKPLNAVTTGLAWITNNITDKYAYKRPASQRINNTSLAQAGHHPRQQVQHLKPPSTIANLNFSTQSPPQQPVGAEMV